MSDATAHVEWEEGRPPENVRIVVDPDKDGRIRCVVHELLHVALTENLRPIMDAVLEEFVILALEEGMDEYIKSSPRRLTSWRRAIETKLAH